MTGKNKEKTAEEIARELAGIVGGVLIRPGKAFIKRSQTCSVRIQFSEQTKPDPITESFALEVFTRTPDLARRVLETIRDFEQEKK